MICLFLSPWKDSGSSPRGPTSSLPNRPAVGTLIVTAAMPPRMPAAIMIVSHPGTSPECMYGPFRSSTTPEMTTAAAPGPTSSPCTAAISLYALSRSAGAKLLAFTPAIMVARPPPSHSVNPSTCTSSQKPRITTSRSSCEPLCVCASSLCIAYEFGHQLPSRISRFHVVPILDLLLAHLPAPEHLPAVHLAVALPQPLLESR